MTDQWTKLWNERYSNHAFAYGETPNDFLKAQLDQLKVGSILFPAEGEGRNGVYAAKLGWSVEAFDISEEGKKKALQLAAANSVTIRYHVGELQNLNFQEEQFDIIALIYAHFPSAIKSIYHKTLNQYLKKGGLIIFEAFSKKHIDYIAQNKEVGGPKDIAMLFSMDEIKSDFPNYEILHLEEK